MTRTLLAATLVLSLAAPAVAGGAAAPSTQVQAATPAAVMASLKAAGYRVTMNPTSPDRDPTMTVTAGDRELQVWLSSCANGVCGRVTASSSWDYSDAEELDTEFLNEWNSNYYTQAYLYEGSVYLDSTMPIRGGYTQATLKAWMTDYLDDVSAFEDELPSE
ncbi:YbjN domain-containing protein [Deinococcus sedimenti]|uniref:YbjN domain-containing protein n=1 Tax=Deinococcus sedimenti TaxID=1867090 RepID=A0ABQ2S4R6_9DEIO|nr:YbjN domain-containing protein [Deinococcus sedimenti]GGR97672.1 hypothetical protein GCM10008960_25500 [Deinococcus sedimenti]